MAASAGTVYVDVKAQKIEGVPGTLANVEINHNHADALIGQLLTYVDATFTDPEQRKAQKQIVKRTVRDWLDAEYDTQERGYSSRATG